MQTKSKPVKNLRELRLKMADKIADFENGELDATELKAITGAASVIVNAVKVELNAIHTISGLTSNIDFLEYAYERKDSVRGIGNEVFSKP